jgi:predicted PurR-regulated permease PerM
MFYLADITADITSALSTAATTVGTLLSAALVIVVSFFVFKIGKRVLSRA